ncbi:hypothetical protein [Streptomyces fradiae]|uniref:hypothetical protein n=1 Tax=Streptomyces fradiae TaxID=1906 RepID=UPI0035BE7F12
MDGDTLRVRFHRDLGIPQRAAVTLALQALIRSHRPAHVLVDVPTSTPSQATLSALFRAYRLCESIGIGFQLTGLGVDAQEFLKTGS